jgi:hypothetical protein
MDVCESVRHVRRVPVITLLERLLGVFSQLRRLLVDCMPTACLLHAYCERRRLGAPREVRRQVWRVQAKCSRELSVCPVG